MVEGKLLIIVIYVDDLILTGNEKLIHSCKEDLAKEFEMKDASFIISLDWKYGSKKVRYLCLKESMIGRYFVSFTCRTESPWILLFQEIGGKRMLHRHR